MVQTLGKIARGTLPQHSPNFRLAKDFRVCVDLSGCLGSAGEELGHALLSRNSSLQCPWCGVVVGRSSWCSFNELCDWRLFVDDWNDVCSSGTVVCWRSIACVGRVGESCCCSRNMRGFFEELSDIGLRGAVF